MATTPIGMGTLFVGYGVGLMGYCWITGRDVSVGALWNPFKPIQTLPAKGTASPFVIIPDGKAGGAPFGAAGVGAAVQGATNQIAAAGAANAGTNPLNGGMAGGAGSTTTTVTDTGTGQAPGTTTAAGRGSGTTTTTTRKAATTAAAGGPSSGGGGGGGPSAGPSGGVSVPSTGNSGITPRQIWTAMRKAGATPIQAAAILGNMQNESLGSGGPEAVGDNGTSFGLVQWNTGSHPNAASLVTGNPQADFAAQIKYLAATGGFAAASGSTISQASSNFSANYENCKTCQPGQAQNVQRTYNSANFLQLATSQKWDQPVGTRVQAKASQGTTALTSGQVASLFPVVGSQGSVPARGGGFGAAGVTVPGVARTTKPKPKPKPVFRAGAGMRGNTKVAVKAKPKPRPKAAPVPQPAARRGRAF